jgi:hypothetical protein
MRRLRKQMTYANVMSSIAVFVVLGGGAYAATTLPKNSVGSKQIKANAVTSSKVKDGSLLGKDFAGSELAKLKGATGATGAAGAAGATGAKGDKGDPATFTNLSFTNLTLKNSWTGDCYGEGLPAIAKSAEGVVRFRGGMCLPTGSSMNPFAIPAALVPSKDQYLTVDLCNAHTGRIWITTDGEVTVDDDPTSSSSEAPCFVSLAGVTYSLPY